jgi:branched-chain amino acid aminotransferase
MTLKTPRRSQSAFWPVCAVIPGGPRSGPGRETRLSSFFWNETRVWVPFPALRAAGDDTGSPLRSRSKRPKAIVIALENRCNPLLAIDGAFRWLFGRSMGERAMSDWSKTWTWIDGVWLEGNPPLIGPRTHGFWLGSSVFDGARAFEGVAPDLDRHCARVNASALALGLVPTMRPDEIEALAREGIARFEAAAALYIRPMYWPETSKRSPVAPDPESTRFLLTIYEAPMPEPAGSSITLSRFRRPTIETMPVNAKAGCLYPNNSRALTEARARGFDNCVLTDMLGNVAELATANLFIARDGVVLTPVANGTFLAGITRSRVFDLLHTSGQATREAVITWQDVLEADEAFSAGNYGKVQPITRIEDRALQPGPLFRRARELYWDFAHGC